MSKPTVHDIAKEAGVSLATVDRVLNARAGVREQTVRRVNTAIEKLGYVRNLSAANLARRREYRYVFVLPDGDSQFVAAIRNAVAEANRVHAADRVGISVLSVPATDPHAIVARLSGLVAEGCDGMAIMAPETPQLRDQIARLRAGGMPIVALVSDLPHSECDHFVGINNIAAGRTAADLMGRFVGRGPGDILVIAQTIQAHDSLQRRLGFDSLMASDHPNLTVLPSLETYGDTARTQQIVTDTLDRNDEVRGVYVLGAGVQASLEALERSGRLADLVVLAHELTPFTRQALANRRIDAVITQNVGHLVRSALRVLRAKTDALDIIPSQERIRIEIVMRENMP